MYFHPHYRDASNCGRWVPLPPCPLCGGRDMRHTKPNPRSGHTGCRKARNTSCVATYDLTIMGKLSLATNDYQNLMKASTPLIFGALCACFKRHYNCSSTKAANGLELRGLSVKV